MYVCVCVVHMDMCVCVCVCVHFITFRILVKKDSFYVRFVSKSISGRQFLVLIKC